MKLKTLNVNLNDRSYPINIGSGILQNLGVCLRSFSLDSTVMLVSNTTVFPLYGKQVFESLKDAGFQTHIAVVPDGERYKSLKVASYLYDEAIKGKLSRYSPIIALGGGVIGDLAGFVAATYMRGVPFVQVPTTLLAQVDSSVGGKVAVNHDQGKNLIGAFYQPLMVLADVEVLKSLEKREIRAGMAEVIKYGFSMDQAFVEMLGQNAVDILNLKQEKMIDMIFRCCQLKGDIVQRDEKEEDLRMILNFGHTVGHALESVTHYQQFRHGEAVALGMMFAAYLAVELDLIPIEYVYDQETLLEQYGLATRMPLLDIDAIMSAMVKDKKVKDNKVRFILPTELGKTVIRDDISWDLVRHVLIKMMGKEY